MDASHGSDDAIKVLCVDDDDLVAQIVRITLKHVHGFEWLGQLRRAEELAAHAASSTPHVVLLDLCMPGKCPFDAIRELGASSPQSRVLMYSAGAGQGMIDRAIETGAWGYLSKEVDGPTLISAIRRVARGEFVMIPHAELAGATCETTGGRAA